MQALTQKSEGENSNESTDEILDGDTPNDVCSLEGGGSDDNQNSTSTTSISSNNNNIVANNNNCDIVKNNNTLNVDKVNGKHKQRKIQPRREVGWLWSFMGIYGNAGS